MEGIVITLVCFSKIVAEMGKFDSLCPCTHYWPITLFFPEMLGMDWWRCGLILRPRTSCITRIPLNYKLVVTNGGVYVLFHFHFLRRFSMSKYSLKSMNYSFRLQLMIRYNSRVHIEVEDTWWGKIGLEKRFLSSGKFDWSMCTGHNCSLNFIPWVGRCIAQVDLREKTNVWSHIQSLQCLKWFWKKRKWSSSYWIEACPNSLSQLIKGWLENLI